MAANSSPYDSSAYLRSCHLSPVRLRTVSRRGYLYLPWILISVLLLQACVSAPGSHDHSAARTSPLTTTDAGGSKSSAVRRQVAQLRDHYQDWRGIPYRWGGNDRRGIDCSGFVHLSYLQLFGEPIPRTTGSQFRVGKAISRTNLIAGDLVFFNNDGGGLHVGIYISGGEFLHASTSRGVMTSSMRTRYWQRRFAGARRVL